LYAVTTNGGAEALCPASGRDATTAIVIAKATDTRARIVMNDSWLFRLWDLGFGL